MGFNSAEISISDLVARVPERELQRRVGELLTEADERLGGNDGLTSESEARDYFEVNAPWIPIQDEEPSQRALELLAAVAPPTEITASGRGFLELRSAFMRITHELRALQRFPDTMPTNAQLAAITKLEGELHRRVESARGLAQAPQFASIAGYANAAIIRLAAVRTWGVFEDGSLRIPHLVEPAREGAVVCARLELAGVRAALNHMRFTEYTVNRGPPAHVARLVETLSGIRDTIAQLQAERGASSRELAQLLEDFNTTLRATAESTYKQRIRGTAVSTIKVGELELPQPLHALQ